MMYLNGFLIRIGKFTSFLALDVLISLLANLTFFSLYWNEKIQPTLILFYLCSVWTLYLADHLWDAYRERGEISERSRFYLQFRIYIICFLILLGLTSLYVGLSFEFHFLLSHLPLLIMFGFFLLLIVIKRSPIPKEILVSLFYTLGVIAPFHSFGANEPMIWIFLIHVFANVLLTYDADREFDQSQKTFTLTKYWKPKTVQIMVQYLLGLGMISLLSLGFLENQSRDFLIGLGLAYIWLGVCSFQKRKGFGFKSLCELSYLPMFLPQIIFFFSLLPS